MGDNRTEEYVETPLWRSLLDEERSICGPSPFKRLLSTCRDELRHSEAARHACIASLQAVIDQQNETAQILTDELSETVIELDKCKRHALLLNDENLRLLHFLIRRIVRILNTAFYRRRMSRCFARWRQTVVLCSPIAKSNDTFVSSTLFVIISFLVFVIAACVSCASAISRLS